MRAAPSLPLLSQQLYNNVVGFQQKPFDTFCFLFHSKQNTQDERGGEEAI